MSFIINALHSEEGFFENELPFRVRRLLSSNLFQIISNPLATIFISAFIWRLTGSFLDVALYSIGRFAFSPIAFWLNGFVLRWVGIRRAFWIGAIASGVAVMSVLFFKDHSSLSVFAYGCLVGLGNCLYWPNRNYLELQEITDGARQYFFSFMYSTTWFSNIFVPVIAGWFIVSGAFIHGYTPVTAYTVLFGLFFLSMLACAKIISDGQFESPLPRQLTRLRTRPVWSRRRMLQIAQGVVDGIGFIVPLILLIFFGNEEVLGIATALVSVCIASAMYLYGRFFNGRHKHQTLIVCSITFILCALGLILLPRPVNAVVYVLLAVGIGNFFSMATEPIVLFLTDTEMAGDTSQRYSFIVDNELFLNVGRVLGVLGVITLVVFGSQTLGVIYGPLAAGILQAFFLAMYFVVRRRNHASKRAVTAP